MSDAYILRLRIIGKVQGTGFRDWAVMEAQARNLNGWVRNRSDGTVEMLLHGPQPIVEDMIGACTKGPEGARVEKIDLEREDKAPLLGFVRKATI